MSPDNDFVMHVQLMAQGKRDFPYITITLYQYQN